MKIWIQRILFLVVTFAFWGFGMTLAGRVVPFQVQKLLGNNHPIRLEYEKYLKKFNDEKSSFILVKNKKRPFTDQEIYSLSKQITAPIDDAEAVTNFIAPHNAKYFSYDDQYFHVIPFFSRETQKLSEEAKAHLESPLWKNNLLNTDHSAFLIQFEFNSRFPREKENDYLNALASEQAQIEKENPDIEIHSLGAKVASSHFMNEMQHQQSTIMPVLFLSIALFMFWFYRSWQILAWNFFVMITCYIATLIYVILIEDGLGPYSSFALMFAFIVATTDLIHFFGRYQQLTGTSEERLKKALEISYMPCFLTSLTTSAGFLALILNEHLPIRYFGLYCAFGCMFEFFLIYHILPRLLKLFNFHAPIRTWNTTGNWINKHSKILQGYSGRILTFSILFVLIGGISSFFLYIDDNFYTKFQKNHPLSASVEAFQREFQFVGSIDILIQPKTGSIISEKNLNRIYDFETELVSHPLISRVGSYQKIHHELNKVLKPWYPESKRFEIEDSILSILRNYGKMDNFYAPDSNELREIVLLKSFTSEDFNKVMTHISNLKEKYGAEFTISTSGFSVIRDYINSRVIHDFLNSFFLGFALIFACFFILYRSWKSAFLAIIPNAIPLVVITGLMSILKIPVDSNLAVLICITFGISGDNTIHLSYVINHQYKNLNFIDGLHQAMKLVGPAMFATSAVFFCSLPSFLLGHLRLFQEMAVFLSLSFITAFFADVILFPSFFVWKNKKVKTLESIDPLETKNIQTI